MPRTPPPLTLVASSAPAGPPTPAPAPADERLRRLGLLSSDWFWTTDAQMRFTSFSRPLGVRGEGLDPDSLALGRRRWELEGVVQDDPGWERHRRQLDARQPFRDFEFRRFAAGRELWFRVSGDPVYGPGGEFAGYEGVSRDITAEREAAERLREARAMLDMAAQIGRLGAWSFEPAAGRFRWSDEVCAIHEVRPGLAPTLEEALGFYVPPWRERMRRTFEACLREGTPFDVEAQAVTARGRRIWVRTLAEAEWDDSGRVRRLYGASQDVSDTRQAAEHVRLMADQLTTTLESLTDAFFTFDCQWRFSYLNTEAERLLRRSRAELLGRTLWDAYPDLLGSPLQEHYLRAVRERVTVQFEEFYAPLGLWVHIKAYPSHQGLAIYARDVTDRVRAQEEILRLNAELEERVRQRTAQLEAANRELEAFSYSIAHDLRSPLASIDGFSQVLAEHAGAGLDDRGRHWLSRIRQAVRHMGDLTEGLLALASLSRTSLRHEPVDLARLAHAAIDGCREQDMARQVEVVIPPALPVQGDPRLLAQVINNLVGNAWKFTARKDGARIEVGRRTHRDGQCAYFVRDNGAGFDMAHAGKLFEAFQRLHTAAEFEGTGIGLAIVQKIVHRHGGRVWAEAAPGRGACFFFTLPGAASAR
jgi:PAS domain S-box-containing protein